MCRLGVRPELIPELDEQLLEPDNILLYHGLDVFLAQLELTDQHLVLEHTNSSQIILTV